MRYSSLLQRLLIQPPKNREASATVHVVDKKVTEEEKAQSPNRPIAHYSTVPTITTDISAPTSHVLARQKILALVPSRTSSVSFEGREVSLLLYYI